MADLPVFNKVDSKIMFHIVGGKDEQNCFETLYIDIYWNIVFRAQSTRLLLKISICKYLLFLSVNTFYLYYDAVGTIWNSTVLKYFKTVLKNK